MKILERIFGRLIYAASALVALCAAYFVWGIASGVIASWSELIPADQARFTQNIQLAGQLLVIASVLAAISIGYINWLRSEIGFVLLLVFVVMYFAIPAGFDWWASQGAVWADGRPLALKAMFTALQNGSYAFVAVGTILILRNITTLIDISKVQSRHAIQHKLGNKPEQSHSDMLLGPCWKLPYCVDFVRDRCPIYLNRKTCWRHKMGCMCEERVIINAMEIERKDGYTPVKLVKIPENKILTPAAKRSRCRQCIIYNHRQHQKYKVALPITLVAAIYVMYAFYGNVCGWILNSLEYLDVVVSKMAFATAGQRITPLGDMIASSHMAVAFLTCVIYVIVMSWILKLLEHAVFEWKI